MLKEILIYIFLLIFPKEDIYVKEHMIDLEYIPEYIYWIDDVNVLLSTYGNTDIYNIQNRNSSNIPTCKECIYGYDKGYVMCNYEHRGIESMEEFSTTIYVYDARENLIYSKDIFPTVIPIYCSRDFVLTKSAYSFLEQKTYILDIQEDVFKGFEFKQNEFNIKGLEKGYITISKRKDTERLIVLDMYYNLWVYSKK